MTRILIPATAAVLVHAAAAVAMSTMDTDADGAVSMEEFKSAYPDLPDTAFMAADADGNGMIDETELADARAAGILPDDQG